ALGQEKWAHRPAGGAFRHCPRRQAVACSKTRAPNENRSADFSPQGLPAAWRPRNHIVRPSSTRILSHRCTQMDADRIRLNDPSSASHFAIFASSLAAICVHLRFNSLSDLNFLRSHVPFASAALLETFTT